VSTQTPPINSFVRRIVRALRDCRMVRPTLRTFSGPQQCRPILSRYYPRGDLEPSTVAFDERGVSFPVGRTTTRQGNRPPDDDSSGPRSSCGRSLLCTFFPLPAAFIASVLRTHSPMPGRQEQSGAGRELTASYPKRLSLSSRMSPQPSFRPSRVPWTCCARLIIETFARGHPFVARLHGESAAESAAPACPKLGVSSLLD